jgi:hypothetical protein
MATGFIDASAHPAAAPFYAKFPKEPTASGSFITVDRAYEISGITFESLLDNISQKAARGGDVLVVSHGTAYGLSLKLTGGAHFKIGDHGAMESLLTDSTSDAASRLQLSEAQVTKLRDKLGKVQDLNINHLALRACKVGSYDTTLNLIKKLFGAASVSAPQKRDAYFFLDPASLGYVTLESQWTAWARDYPLNPIEGTSPKRFCIRAKEHDDGTHTFSTKNLAESADAVTQWVQAHWYGAETFTYTRGSIALHAMWNDPLFYPKDTDYTANLTFFIKPETLF